MSLNAATLKLLVAKGLTAEDIVEVAEAIEAGKPRSTNAERQARYRERQRNERNVTRNVTPPPIDNNHTPPPVSDETGLAASRKSKRGTRLADDFEPPADWIEWAVSKKGWSRTDAIEECECFARYWQAKPGREALKLDWPKTWQNWVANSNRQRTSRPTGPPGGDFWEHYKSERAAVGH